MATEQAIEYRDLGPLGFPGYRVGDDGSVLTQWRKSSLGYGRGWCQIRGHEWKHRVLQTSRQGYRRVKIGDRFLLVHRLVLAAFVGPCPEGMQCCHFDGDSGNNRLSNLRWDTGSANYDDAVRHGTKWPRQLLPGRAVGERHWKAKLCNADIADILARHSAGETKASIAADKGVSSMTIYRVVKGLNWRHLAVPLIAEPTSS